MGSAKTVLDVYVKGLIGAFEKSDEVASDAAT